MTSPRDADPGTRRPPPRCSSHRPRRPRHPASFSPPPRCEAAPDADDVDRDADNPGTQTPPRRPAAPADPSPGLLLPTATVPPPRTVKTSAAALTPAPALARSTAGFSKAKHDEKADINDLNFDMICC